MNNIKIREATMDDMQTLLLFEQGVVAAERPFDSTLKKEHIRYYNLEHMIHAGHIHLIIAELNSELVGCGYARIEEAKHYLQHAQYAYLGFMFVSPAHRGKGINKIIIDALCKWSLSKNIDEVRLDVYYENSPAISAYEKAGFMKHMVEMRRGLSK